MIEYTRGDRVRLTNMETEGTVVNQTEEGVTITWDDQPEAVGPYDAEDLEPVGNVFHLRSVDAGETVDEPLTGQWYSVGTVTELDVAMALGPKATSPQIGAIWALLNIAFVDGLESPEGPDIVSPYEDAPDWNRLAGEIARLKSLA